MSKLRFGFSSSLRVFINFLFFLKRLAVTESVFSDSFLLLFFISPLSAGQTKQVKVYRVITKNTYEQKMFARASLKLGLDQAVLTNLRAGVRADDTENPSDIKYNFVFVIDTRTYHMFL